MGRADHHRHHHHPAKILNITTTMNCCWRLLLLVVCMCQRVANTQGMNSITCERRPGHTRAHKSPGDNGFSIKILGTPSAEYYTPGEDYRGMCLFDRLIIYPALNLIFSGLTPMLWKELLSKVGKTFSCTV